MEVPRLWGINGNHRLNCEYLWSNSSKQKAGWAPFFSKDSRCWKINYPLAWGVLGSSNREILLTSYLGAAFYFFAHSWFIISFGLTELLYFQEPLLYIRSRDVWNLNWLTSSWLLGTAQYPDPKPPSMAAMWGGFMGAEINQNLPNEIGHFGCWMLDAAMLGSVQFLHECAGCNVGKSSIVSPFICDMLVFYIPIFGWSVCFCLLQSDRKSVV